ncbi:MAG TPA: extracellular solute-binding protein [Pirellulales bacterium]|nr:extracellular solute-binding protein [Pirellulales bacterium]
MHNAAIQNPKSKIQNGGALLLALAFVAGCTRQQEQEVVVYSALDAEFSRPILEQFESQTGIKVLPKFDVESNKTLGLTQAIIAESAQRPRCDVFWNNEILNTLRLEERGLLEAYRPKMADTFPAIYRSQKRTWHGFAARARVLLVNTELVAGDELPGSIDDLTDEKWRGRCGLAKPLFGTTATHVACLFALLGDEKAKRLLSEIKANEVQVFAGNKQVAQAVAQGQLAFGFTDTDDAMIELEEAQPVKIVYPDQQEGGMGTLFIPNTLAIIKSSSHSVEARQLVDYLLTPAIEVELARGASAQIPLCSKVDVPLRVETPHTVRPMAVDFYKAADKWDAAARFVRDLFAGAD